MRLMQHKNLKKKISLSLLYQKVHQAVKNRPSLLLEFYIVEDIDETRTQRLRVNNNAWDEHKQYYLEIVKRSLLSTDYSYALFRSGEILSELIGTKVWASLLGSYVTIWPIINVFAIT